MWNKYWDWSHGPWRSFQHSLLFPKRHREISIFPAFTQRSVIFRGILRETPSNAEESNTQDSYQYSSKEWGGPDLALPTHLKTSDFRGQPPYIFSSNMHLSPLLHKISLHGIGVRALKGNADFLTGIEVFCFDACSTVQQLLLCYVGN